ncbi:MAG TPA: flagellar basal body L-ring protein FlgH [Bryobacteraceae bacterium]|nr:flagellar basal body L-ring protein FlgH [Bryobacteraceae bacterium]
MKLILLLVFVPLLGQAQRSPGSLYIQGGQLSDLARDLRANSVGDVVTVVVNDFASALAKGVTNTSRKSSDKASISGLVGATNPRLSNLLGLSNDRELQGQGQTSRDMTISTTISARVMEVKPNGSLVVEGVKNVGINSEKQSITLRGVIRPADITVANTISSNQVADLTIQVNGKGVVGDAIRRPHFLYRLLLGLLPF